MSETADKCNKCSRERDIPIFASKNGPTRWQATCKSCSKRQLDAVNIREFYRDVGRRVQHARREAERNSLLDEEVEVNAVVELPVFIDDFGWEAVRRELRPFANSIADAVREKTEWGFSFHECKMTGTGPTYIFRCRQDRRNSRSRNGKKATGTAGRSRQKATRVDCRGSLRVNVDVGGGIARLRFLHRHHHFAFKHVKLSDSIEKEALRLLNDGVSKPSVLFQSLMGRLSEKDQEIVTENQIRSLVTRERNRRLGFDPSLLAQAKSMEEQINLVMPRIEKLAFCSASDADGWESFVWTVNPFNELAADATELLFDGTHGTTAQDFEVVVCLAEKRGHAYPVALLALRPSKSRQVGARLKAQSRLHVIESFFDVIRTRQSVHPQVVHVDKDFSEISAIQRVWPSSTIHICLWHMKKAVERGLAQPPTEKGTLYNPEEVALFLPTVDREFLPLNPKTPKRVLVDPYRHATPAPPCSSPSPFSPSPPPVAPLSPLSQFRAFLGQFVPAPQQPAPISDEEAAERRRLEYDEEEEGDEPWQASFEEMSGGPISAGFRERSENEVQGIQETLPIQRDVANNGVQAWTAEERRKQSQRNLRDDPTLPRALKPDRSKFSEMMGLHSFRHPSIPTSRGYLSAEEHYLECLEAMYQFCLEKGLADAWAYLWENWYRPGRWELWTRASCTLVPILRTTMGAEAFFRALKNDWLGRRRTSLIGLVKLIGVNVVAHYEHILKRLEHGDLTQNFRLARSRWRYKFKKNERRIYSNEHARRNNAAAIRNGQGSRERVEDKDVQDNRSAPSTLRVVRAPSFLPPVHIDPSTSSAQANAEDGIPIDPELIGLGPSTLSHPIGPVPPLHTAHFFDSKLQVCSCPAFLRSQFLRCKHITLSTKQEVLGDGTPEDEDRWFEVVERHTLPPFWRVPEAAKEVARRKKLGLETTKEIWDSFSREEEQEKRNGFASDNDESSDEESLWGIGDSSGQDSDASSESEEAGSDAEEEEPGGSSPGLSARPRHASSMSEDFNDYVSQDLDRSKYYDDGIRSLAALTELFEDLHSKQGDPRGLGSFSQELSTLVKRFKKERTESVGSGGLSSERSGKRKKRPSKERGDGKENAPLTKKKRKPRSSLTYV